MKKSIITAFLIILFSFALGACFYSKMPDTMASHWNASGEADGYSSKSFGLFLLPSISIVLLLFFLLIPKIDPLRQNILKFKKHYGNFILLITAFLSYIYLLSLLWNLGFRFSMARMLSPAFGILFYYSGVLVENAKKNWFIGIRTPWTLSSEKVWDKTHKIGGRLFKIIGVLAFFSIFFPKYALLLVIILALFVVLYTILYSYFEYRKLKK